MPSSWYVDTAFLNSQQKTHFCSFSKKLLLFNFLELAVTSQSREIKCFRAASEFINTFAASFRLQRTLADSIFFFINCADFMPFFCFSNSFPHFFFAFYLQITDLSNNSTIHFATVFFFFSYILSLCSHLIHLFFCIS